MIVTCQKCRTKFRLKPGLMKPEGAYVRCSRCDTVFRAVLPARGRSAGPPPNITDEEYVLYGGPAPATPPEPEPEVFAPAEPTLADERPESALSEEPPGPSLGLPEPAAPPLSSAALEPLAAAPPQTGPAPVVKEAAFAPAGAQPTALAPGLPEPAPVQPVAAPAPAQALPPARTEKAVEAALKRAAEALATAPPTQPEPVPPAEVPPEAAAEATPAPAEEPWPEAEQPAAAAPLPPLPPPRPAAGRRWALWRTTGARRSSPLAVAMLAAVALAVLGLAGYRAGMIKWEGSDPKGSRHISFAGVGKFWLKTDQDGFLYVIQGLARNGYDDKRGNIRIRAVIYDSAGKQVREQEVYAGNVFSREELQRMTLSDVTDRLSSPGEDGSGSVARPGGSVPFMAVFGDLPQNLGEFRLEAAGSNRAASS